MTPVPHGNNFGGAGGWGGPLDSHSGYNNGYPSDFSAGKAGGHFSNPSNNYNYNQYEGDSSSLLYDSKYSPNHTGNMPAFNRELSSQQ